MSHIVGLNDLHVGEKAVSGINGHCQAAITCANQVNFTSGCHWYWGSQLNFNHLAFRFNF